MTLWNAIELPLEATTLDNYFSFLRIKTNDDILRHNRVTLGHAMMHLDNISLSLLRKLIPCYQVSYNISKSIYSNTSLDIKDIVLFKSQTRNISFGTLN